LFTDDISKNMMDEVRAELLLRFPDMPLAAQPIERPPNMLNNAEAAANWTAKSDEGFDQ
jgi:hypothetical protein